MALTPQAELLNKRDKKTIPHLEQYAPVWIIDQKHIPQDESVQFNVMFHHNLYGWVNRRYLYDGFNDVLYHKGQMRIPEEQAGEILENEPWLAREVADIPNSYGG